MATLIITDIDNMGNQDREVYTGHAWADVTALLRAELERTSSEEFTTYVMDMWEVEHGFGSRVNYTFTVSNTASDVHLTDRGTRTKFTYLG